MTGNTEEAEVEQLYEDLKNLLELISKKDVLFSIGDWNAKAGSQETPGVTVQPPCHHNRKAGSEFLGLISCL